MFSTLQTCRKKTWNLQGHSCNCCQNVAHYILDAKKQITFAEYQRQRTESRRNAEAKRMKNVNDGKGVKDEKSVKDENELAKK